MICFLSSSSFAYYCRYYIYIVVVVVEMDMMMMKDVCNAHSQCGQACDDDPSTQSTKGSPIRPKMKCYISPVLIALIWGAIETEAQQTRTVSATFTQKGFYTDYGCTNLAYVSD